eukprot:39239-Prorocentrum_minimum.AAC.3
MLVSGTPCLKRNPSLSSCLGKFQRARVQQRVQNAKPSNRCQRPCVTRVSASVPGDDSTATETRRRLVLSAAALVGGLTISPLSSRAEYVDLPALRGKDYGKPVAIYPDYVLTESALQYKDLRIGAGEQPKAGDRVVCDWDGKSLNAHPTRVKNLVCVSQSS